MMGRALLIIGALATLGFLGSGVLGYLLEGPASPNMTRHVLLALASCLMILFSHCWILFYLVGTGRAIRSTVEESGLDAGYGEQAGRLIRSAAPWLLASIGLAMATFVLGGAASTGAVKPWIHHVLFILTMLAQGWTLWLENRLLRDNQRLIEEVDRSVAQLGQHGHATPGATAG